MIDAPLRAALVTSLARSFPGPRDDARDRELGEIADTMIGIVRAYDGSKVVALRPAPAPHADASTPGWDDPRKAGQHEPTER